MKTFDGSYKALEYNKILALLAACTATEGAALLAAELIPSSDPVTVSRLLSETEEACALLTVKGEPPFGRAKNILPALDRAVKGAVLSTRELLDIASVLRSVSALIAYFSAAGGTALEPYFGSLRGDKKLERAVSDAIAAEDIINDNASDKLFRIRREMKKCESGVKDALAAYLSGQYSKYLQENLVTQRGGRYVVPVKSEYKNEIKGLVHDTSASGATLFIEPLAVLEINNRLRELKGEESAEIERILTELSAWAAQSADILETDYNALTELALIFAKGSLAHKHRASRPAISGDGTLRLVRARHPLLNPVTVVPISVEFGKNQRTLVITGPNTGGKTVTLKTIGLLAMMTQSGLFAPCDYGSSLPVFDSILADIGDEQSIEQSLSTFSSHMVNIVDIMRKCASRSLVLLDELGAGTDPTEGAALAIAILEKIKQKGALSAATTHYSELKLYALENEEVLNASCEFDVETLRPTYRLITGLPGRSNAFAISSRLGMDAAVIDRAAELVADDSRRFEDVLGTLRETETKLEKEKQYAAKIKAEAESALKEAEARTAEAEERAKSELDKAYEQAARILARAKASSEYVFDEIAKLNREKDKADAKERLEKARASVKSSLKSADYVPEEEETERIEYHPPRPFTQGDSVILADIGRGGIIKEISGENAVVAAGHMEIKTKLANLRLGEVKRTGKKQPKASAGGVKLSAAVKNEIDVRGENGDDAWFIIDRYLEDAIRAGYESVSIIHGKGTGALRNALWRFFKSDRRISEFRSGRYGEGDTGVTILTLKK